MEINIAIVGCGNWGKNIARNASELGVLATVCDSNKKNAEAFSQQFSCPSSSFEQILQDETISGIVVVTNPASHEKLACEALKAGKHVYIEKPLTLSMESAKLIRQTAVKAKRQVMVGHLLQYHPAYIELKRQVNNGAIGELQHIHANRLAMGRIRKSESAIYDLCPHDLSIILGLVGHMPISISCESASHVTKNGGDIVFTSFKFPGNITAIMHDSWYSPYKEHRLVVTGTEGSLVFDDTKPSIQKLIFYKDKLMDGDDDVNIERSSPVFLPIEDAQPLRNEIIAFINVCRTNTPAITDVEEALKVQEILTEMSRQTQQEKL